MLSVADYKQLKLLYEKFENFSLYIKKLALDNDWETVEQAVIDKGKLMNQIIFFEKPRLKYIKENSELMKIRTKIVELEKQNIVLIAEMKADLLKDLQNVKKAKKVLNAYEPATRDDVSTFEIQQEG